MRAWLTIATKAHWSTPTEIKLSDRAVSFVGNNRVVFNIGGRRFRLVASVAYEFQAMYIKFVGTHAEYDKIDASTVDMDY
ncbi:type II toxin-antitoxin system HigB family toxin [Massilia sp. SR12]